MSKDWIGNSKSAYVCNGASSHSDGEREINDYYATEPLAAEWLIKITDLNKKIWECCCGEGHLAKALENQGYDVYSTDLIYRGYGMGEVDFLEQTKVFKGDIVTNPPYSKARQFVEHALDLVKEGNKVCMFLKLTFLEGKARRDLFEKTPPKEVWVSSSRIKCAKNGEFVINGKSVSSAVAYAWYIWEKGYEGKTVLRWFN